jgi:SAM-dependent methyltransferase
MEGLRVLDLGCGFGWFSRWARQAGASSVTGVDLSERMLERARNETKDDAIVYRRADLESFAIEPGSFELIYSSLTLHYLQDLSGLVGRMFAGLVAGGRLVFSVEHPIYTAPSQPQWTGSTWPIERYLDEGPRNTNWLAKGVIKQHRTVARYVNTLLEAGFSLERIEEWSPSQAQIAAHPEWQNERQRPPFLLVSARR